MKSRWSDAEAAAFPGDLGQRVYTSRLLGRDPATGVDERHYDVRVSSLGAHPQDAAVPHRLHGIPDNVVERLLELGPIQQNLRLAIPRVFVCSFFGAPEIIEYNPVYNHTR